MTAILYIIYIALTGTITVDCDDPNCINNPNMQCSIKEAINVAVPGDKIIVQPGTCQEMVDFRGKAVTLQSISGPENTIIDGTNRIGGIWFWNQEDPDTVVDGFTITGVNTPLIGGGMWINDDSSPTVRNCILKGNSSNFEGGGMYIGANANPMITNCQFINNHVDSVGGAISTFRANPQIINCTFYNNSAPTGAAVAVHEGTATIINCTFSNNIGDEGIINRSGSVSLTNSIVSNTTLSGQISAIYSNIQDGWPGIGNIDLDPFFINSTLGNLRLRFISPCVDAGNSESVPSTLAHDLDGNTRIANIVDMGAYERISPFVYWTGGTDNGQIVRSMVHETTGTVLEELEYPRGIVLDLQDNKMYWVELNTSEIHRSNLDGTQIETIVSGLNFNGGLVLDVSNNHIYWTANDLFTLKSVVQRSQLDGSNIKTLVALGDFGSSYFVGLDLDLHNNKIYWTDLQRVDEPGRIQRANLDGSIVETIINDVDSCDIALDTTGGKIYWTDLSGTIKRSDLDGDDIENLVITDIPLGIDLDSCERKIYWTDSNGLNRSDFNGMNIEPIDQRIDSWGVTVASDPLLPECVQIAPVLVDAISQKFHGTIGNLDLNLDLDGETVECRLGGVEKVILSFNKPVHPVDGDFNDEIDISQGIIIGQEIIGNTIVINIFEPSDRYCLTITMSGLADIAGNLFKGPNEFSVRVLFGDVRSDGIVNLLDQSQIKQKLFQTVNQSTICLDINTDGMINILDQNLIKANLFESISCP